MIVELLTRQAGAVFVAVYVVVLMAWEVARQLTPDGHHRRTRLVNRAAGALLVLFVVIVTTRFLKLS
jgi:threonine/homoserine/homoserine lactone efflux protein